MGFTTLSLGLTLTIPTNGTRNYGNTLFSTTWTKISNHGHTGSGDGNLMTTASYTDYSVTTVKLSKNVGVTIAATVTPSGTTQTLDFSLGNVQPIGLGSASGDVTLTLSNPVTGATYTIIATQGATARNLIWPASVKWPQAQAPILSIVNGEVDKITLFWNGTDYKGDWNVAYA